MFSEHDSDDFQRVISTALNGELSDSSLTFGVNGLKHFTSLHEESKHHSLASCSLSLQKHLWHCFSAPEEKHIYILLVLEFKSDRTYEINWETWRRTARKEDKRQGKPGNQPWHFQLRAPFVAAHVWLCRRETPAVYGPVITFYQAESLSMRHGYS